MKINYLKLLAALTILTGIIIIGRKTDKVVTPSGLFTLPISQADPIL